MQPRATGSLACLTLAALLASPAAAEEDKRFGEEILEILREEGKIDDARYRELKEKEAAEAAAQQEPDPDGWTIRYKNAIQFNKNDGMVKLKMGGRVQTDFASINPESDLNRAVSGGDGEGVEIRRARLYTSVDLYDRIIGKAQFDFAGGDVDVADAYIGMKNLGFLGTAKVGHFKEPFSLEQLTSSQHAPFMERSLGSSLDEGRNFGLGFSNSILDGRMTWATGIFRKTDSTGDSFSEDTSFQVTSRVSGLPLYANDGRRLIHLGVAGSYQVRDSIDFRFRARPEIHQAQFYIDTGNRTGQNATDGNGLLGLEAGAVFGPVHMAVELKQAWIDQVGGRDLYGFGGYAQVGLFLTGESRLYNKKTGTWARLSPTDPFDPENGKWGAVEIATRYSRLDLNNHNLNAGKEQNVTVALNWYLFSNVRLSANYVYANVRSTGDALGNARGDIHGIQARAQLEF